MDFPKSVPNIGLIGGRFVDENTGTGQPGSLIPAVWGNSVTLEILSVLTAAGIVPDEMKTDQLATAINKIVSTNTAWEKITNKPLQTEAYDGTAGRLTLTGAFGWGSTYGAPAYLLSDMTGSQANFSGLYRYQNSTNGRPPFGSGYGSLLHASVVNDSGNNYATQLTIDYAADEIGFRRLTGGAGWQPFRRIWHDGNLDVATETVAGIAKKASQVLTDAGADDTSFITAKKLAAWFTAKVGQATVSVAGLIKIATDQLIAGGVDNTTAVTPLGLKNKSQATAYDPAASKLLSTGSFGVGSTYIAGPAYVSDASGSQMTGTGQYRYDTSTAGRPPFGSGFGSLSHAALLSDANGNYGTQLAIDYANDAIGFRRLAGAAGWRPWVELFHKGNLGQATTSAPGLAQLATSADVLAGTSSTLIPSVAALVAGLLGAGGRASTDYLVIPYVDKITGARRNKILQWTITPGLTNASAWTWTYPAAYTTGVQFMGGMMIGSSSGALQTNSYGLSNAQLSNGSSGSNANTAFVFVIGE